MNLRRATARDAETLARLNRFGHEPPLTERPDYFTVVDIDVDLSSWAFNGDAHAMFRQLGFQPRVVVFERRAH